MVYLGFGWVGATAGLVVGFAVQVVVLMLGVFRVYSLRCSAFSWGVVFELLVAGLVVWVPQMLTVVGRWSGVLAVLGFKGAVETGLFYIAMAIYMVVFSVPSSFVLLSMPVMSGMREGREVFLRRVLKLSLWVGGVVSPALFYFSWVPLSFFGSAYLGVSDALSLLSLSIIPMLIVTSANSLVYARGDYRSSFILGLAVNVPQVIFYVLATPYLGAFGAALGYFVGSLCGAVVAFSLTRGSYEWPLRELLLSFLGFAVFLPLYLLRVSWIPALVIGVVSTGLLLPKLGIIRRFELSSISGEEEGAISKVLLVISKLVVE